MTKLYNSNDEQLSLFCGIPSRPSHDAIILKSRTLGGGYHYQTIGNAIKSKEIQLVVHKDKTDVISELYASSSKVKLIEDDAYFICIIKDGPVWKRESKTLYSGKLSLIITEEGVV